MHEIASTNSGCHYQGSYSKETLVPGSRLLPPLANQEDRMGAFIGYVKIPLLFKIVQRSKGTDSKGEKESGGD